jgi:uncharacterized protein
MQQIRIDRPSVIVLIASLAFMAVEGLSINAQDSNPGIKPKSRANRLANESSPYLLLHAHNPVDWYPWGSDAFEKAKKEGKLIFLSVGYSSCYWCHVMERNVFTNEAIARTLNENFVCIKVDREERPDIDDIYMTALQVYYQMIGSPSNGGWPLSIFMTPDGKPVAGGTYFPPEDTNGSQGFSSVLDRLMDLWKNKHDQMEGNAEILAKETRRLMRPKVSLKQVPVDEKLVETAFLAISSSFDPEFGGIDFNPKRPDGPKFPTPTKLTFIQHILQKTPNDDISEQLELTLMQIACGGIRDHVGGGFHRYSVDRHWDVPHFEKMLYDQAQLADVYVEAYRTTNQPPNKSISLYKQVAEELFQFVAREMTSPDGGFYSALDAETGGIEGEYFVWDATEIDKVLGTAAKAFKEAYRVKDLSDFEHGNVLRLSHKRLPQPTPATTAGAEKTPIGSERDQFTVSRQKLLEVRNKRQRPLRDEKILTCWNGLMIGAYARAAGPLQHPEYLVIAEKAASFLLSNLRDPQGRLLHTYTSGQAKLNAYLDDYAFLIDGLLALYDATEDVKWLKSAKQLQDEQLRSFLDETNGGFFFTPHHHEELLARTKNSYDGVLPAGNSVSARNLIKLAKLTGISAYREEARATIELFASNIEQTPRGLANLALAAHELLESEAGAKGAASHERSQIIPAAGSDEKKVPNEPLVVFADSKLPKNDELVTGRAYLSTDKLPAGSTCKLIVLLDVKEGWHINQNPPMPDHLIPTKVSSKSKLGVKLSDVKYPDGHGFKFDGEEMEAMVYEGEVAIRGTLTVPEAAAGQTDELEITITYQACNDTGCRPPKTIKLTNKLAAMRGDSVKPINARLFKEMPKANKQ